MKNIKPLLSILFISLFISITSCSSDDNNSDNSSVDSCLKDDFELVETNINDLAASSNDVIITFDVTNNSSFDYSIQNGSTPIDAKIIVTTSDGDKFEKTDILPISSLSAGSKTSVEVLATYGANKTFSSYEISLTCR